MHCLYSPLHTQHAPEFEFFRGDKVPCFESPQRLQYVLDAIRDQGFALHEVATDAAANAVHSDRVLTQVHAPRYLHFLATAWQQWLALDASNAKRQPFPSVWPVRSLRSDIEPDNFIARLGLYSMDNGTPLVAGSWAAARAGAEVALAGAQYLRRGGQAVFCATRPPGHHAGADFMGGYCFLNNAAIAAQSLLNDGAQRVVILDVDYHHGNGTQSIFYERDDVLFVSIHGDPRSEYPFYLGYGDETGAGVGLGFNLNLPLPAGSSAENWFSALELACQRVASYGADALVVSLGLDTFVDDPISTFQLQSTDYLRLGRRLRKLGLASVLILEGGYAAQELGTNAVNVLLGFEG